MNTIYHTTTNDLDKDFLERLRTKHGNVNVEIRVQDPNAIEILNEAAFWKLIKLLDWEKTGDDEAVVAPLTQALTKLPIAHIYQFEDWLSEKLYHLDTLAHAQHSGDNAYNDGEDFSVDLFLYDRCAVVANGQECYKEVLQNPSAMLKDVSFEPLLYVASDAYELKTDKPFEYQPTYNSETFNNRTAWQKNT